MNTKLWFLWPLVIGTFALGLDAYVLAGLLPAMASSLHTTQANVGLGVALFTAAYAVSAPFIAPWYASRTSARFALLSGTGIFITGNLLTLLSPSLCWLLFSRLLAGLGAGVYSPLASACAAGAVDESYRGRALALVLSGLSVGTALGVPAGLLIERITGWRGTIGLIILLGIIAMMGMLASRFRFSAPKTISLKSRLQALTSGPTLLTLVITLFTGIASLGLYTFIAEVLSDKKMTPSVALLIWFWGLGGLTGALLIGHVIDRLITPWLTTLILLVILESSFLAFGYGSLYLCLAGAFFWGLSGWASIAPQQHALVNYSPERSVSLIGWNSSANYAGGAIGILAGSLLLNLHHSPGLLPVLATAVILLTIIIHLVKKLITSS